MKNSNIYQTSAFRMGSIFSNPSYQQASQNTGTTTTGILTANDTSLTFMFFAASPQAYNDNPADFYIDNIVIEEVTEVQCSDAEILAFNMQNGKYRYKFNGKELDPESGKYDYGFRMYNAELARFLSVDPLTKSYPNLSPYPYAMNRPIDGVDMDGLEHVATTSFKFNTNTFHLQIVNTVTITVKVVNISSLIIDPEIIKTKAELFKSSVERDLSTDNYDNSSPVVYRTNVNLDFTKGAPPRDWDTDKGTSSDDGQIGYLIFYDAKTEISKKMTNLTTQQVTESKTYGYTWPGIDRFSIHIAVTMDGIEIPDNSLQRTSTHETLHAPGGNHPWELSAKEKRAMPQLDQNGSKRNPAVIKRNIMNSGENLIDELNSN